MDHPPRPLVAKFFLVAIVISGLVISRTPVRAQRDVSTDDIGGCTLKNHVYTCDEAAFQAALAGAKAVSIETHNADGVARGQLMELITKKLGKTVAPTGSPADLNLLLMPTGEVGVIDTSPGDVDLGTLRVYTSAAGGARGHLVWAETFSGKPDLPWPVVVRGLILQLQSRFHIK
jgi:hypothetical protein